MTRRNVLALGLIAVVLAGCARSTAGGSGSSGVNGRAIAGPSCPVQQVNSPCPDRPVPNAQVRIMRGSEVVTTVRADGTGRFRVALPPGGYELVGLPGQNPLPRPSSTSVTVPTDGWAAATVVFDTGIR